ncbi:MAG: hypothetical protein ACE5E6_03035, partial [Phycisphaerae bacterium]
MTGSGGAARPGAVAASTGPQHAGPRASSAPVAPTRFPVEPTLFPIDAPRFPRTRYQGSKRKLAAAIVARLSDLAYRTVLDAFGGTGAV